MVTNILKTLINNVIVSNTSTVCLNSIVESRETTEDEKDGEIQTIEVHGLDTKL